MQSGETGMEQKNISDTNIRNFHVKILLGTLIIFMLVFAGAQAVMGAGIDGSLAYYSFDTADVDGNTIIDLNASANVTNNGAISNSSGKINEAFTFRNDTDDNMTANGPIGNVGGVSVWVRSRNDIAFDRNGAANGIITNFTSNLRASLLVGGDIFSTVANERISITGPSSTNFWYYTNTSIDASFNAGVFSHICIFDSGGNNLQMVLNGVDYGNALTRNSPTWDSWQGYVPLIGDGTPAAGPPTRDWDGEIDELAFFGNPNLTVNRCQEIFASGSGNQYPFPDQPPSVNQSILNTSNATPTAGTGATGVLQAWARVDDTDNDPVNATWRLFVNGSLSQSGTDAIAQGTLVNFRNFTVTESGSYILEVFGDDEITQSSALNSSAQNMIFTNFAPNIVTIVLNSTNPNSSTGSAKILIRVNATDINAGNLHRYEWTLFLNGTIDQTGVTVGATPGITITLLDSTKTASGTYIVQINASDGSLEAPLQNSTALIISLMVPPPTDAEKLNNMSSQMLIVGLIIIVFFGLLTELVVINETTRLGLRISILFIALSVGVSVFILGF